PQRKTLFASLTNDDGLPRKIAKRIVTFQPRILRYYEVSFLHPSTFH
ncbi:11848_t:CDS:1, partial [Funneliformis mosseae]